MEYEVSDEKGNSGGKNSGSNLVNIKIIIDCNYCHLDLNQIQQFMVEVGVVMFRYYIVQKLYYYSMSSQIKGKVSTASTNEGEEKQVQKPSSSGMVKICSFFCLLILISVFSIPLIYLFGEEKLHEDKFHSLSSVFETEDYKQVLKDLNKKKTKHINLYGKENGGLFQFAEFYADTLAKKGKEVVVRRYNDNPLQSAFSLLRKTKVFLQDHLDFEEDLSKSLTWILIVQNAQFPEEDLKVIEQRHKNSKIILVSEQMTKLPTFKHLQYPSLTVDMIKPLITSKYKIAEQELTIILNHYQNLTKLFFAFENVEKYSHATFLKSNYHNLHKLKEGDKAALKLLCEKGVATATKTLIDGSFGIVVHDTLMYWKNSESILNYELQYLVMCKKEIVPEKVLNEKKKQKKQEKKKKQKQKEVKSSKKNTDL